MNEANCVFAEADSLVEVPYVKPSFLGSLNVMSMIPMFHGIRMNDMNNVIFYWNYDICYVYAVVFSVQNVKYDDACYSHGITLLIKIRKAHEHS